jgi:hypothetical protein
MRNRILVLGLISCTLAVNSFAQTSTAAASPSQEERMKALEERIIALEGEIRMLKVAQPARPATAAVPAPTTEAATAAAVPQVAAPAGGAEQTGPLPVYGGATGQAKALNPDISIIGDFLGAAGHNPIRPVPSFEMHESEVGLQAIIDPYARGDFFISFGEEGVEVEEGYITLTALPAGLVVKGGKMRSAFGKVNTLHNHVLPWTDRPLVTENLVGGEDGIDDAGFSLTRILPAPKGLFLEGTAQVFRGDSSDVFTANNRSDLSVVGHLRGYRDITEATNLDIGVSYARGHNDLGSRFLTNLYGVDATLRWKPLRRSIYHSFVGRSEFVWSHREETLATQRAFGFYASGDYQLGRRWFVGARVDRSDRARNPAQTDNGASLVFTYWPSEFSQVRTQYRFANYAEGIKTNELRMQLQFSLGAHGAHPF